jgi:flagellar basal-body rod protein FlgG
MNNAIYAAASGMLTRSNSMDIVGNNLANAGTAGFKKDRMLTSDFGSQLTYNFNGDATQIGSTNNGATSAGIYTTYEQGTFEVTGNSLDLALKGEGFFTLAQPNGNKVLSRDGRFSVDGDGFLVNSAGSFVMGKKGKIKADASDFKVNGDGEIFINNQLSDKLLITVPQNNNNLRKLSDGQISNAANLPISFS